MLVEITPARFIGTVSDAQDARALSANGILRVISLIDQDDIDDFKRVPGVSYELYELWDGDAPALLHACRQVSFDERATLVHCSAGLSRSVSLVAYHLRREGVVDNIDDAYALIAEKKIVRPHKNFVKLLRKKLR